MTPGVKHQSISGACQCTPTQALDHIEQTLIGRRSRVVSALSFAADRALRNAIDDLEVRADEEDNDFFFELAAELAQLRKHATRGMCPDCGSYDGCNCDDMADQQSTGGY